MPLVQAETSTVEAAATHLGDGKPLVVHGLRGSGKSRFLLRLWHWLEQQPVLLSPALGDGDAIESSFVMLADRVAPDADTAARIRDPERPTRDKVALLRKLLTDRRDLTVLLDDPDGWALDRPRDTALDLREELLDLIRMSGAQVVVAARRALAVFAVDGHEIELPTMPSDARTYAERLDWGELQPLAERVAEREPTRAMPAWAFRARVLGELAEVPHSSWTDRRWLERVFAALRETHPPVAAGWSALATLRQLEERRFADRILEELVDPLHRQAVEHCLLGMAAQADFRLLPVMRKVALSADEAAAQSLHEELASYWSARDTLVGAFEAFHHHGRAAASSGALDEAPPVLLEQVHTFGRWLSMRRSYDEAAAVFDHAVRRDPRDDYAHHYLAYNLDADGREPERVDTHYRLAIDLNPLQPWWHSRFIRFLVTRERIDEARAAWSSALTALALDDAEADDPVFNDLHAEVARQLLDALELDFAAEVLDSAPAGVEEEHQRLQELRERLGELRAATEGSPYLPLASELAVAEEPLLLPASHEQLGELDTWWAARVDAVENGLVRLSAEEHAAERIELVHSDTTVEALRADGVAEASIAAGRLLEIGFYDGGGSLALAHPETRRATWALQRPFPDPMRYVRREAG